MRTFFVVFILSCLSVCIFTWPFFTKLSSFYQDHGRYGDYTFIGSTIWYHTESLLNGRIFNTERYYNGFQLYPLPNTLAYTNNTFFPSFLFLPFYFFSKNLIFSLNTTTFFTLVLNIVSAFYVIRYFVKNSKASFIGGLIYTFNPLSFAHFPQHLDFQTRYLLPPLFLFTYLFFKNPRPKYAFLSGLFFTLTALSVIYFEIFSLVLLPLAILPFVIQNSLKKNIRYFINLLKYGSISLIFLPVLLYFQIPYLLASQKESLSRSLGENVFYSARLIDYISSTPHSLLYGGFVRSIDSKRLYKNDASGLLSYEVPFEEHTLFLNLLPMLLFGIGIYVLFIKKDKQKSKKIDFSFFLIILIFSFLFTLGPYFQGWNGTSLAIPLPFSFLYHNFFLFKAIRSPTRFLYMFYLPFSLFAAYGTHFLFKKYKKYGYILFGSVLVFLFLESYNLNSFSETSSIISKFKSLNQNNQLSFLQNKKTIHLPIFFPNIIKDSMYINWATQSKEIMMNGNNAFIPQDQINFLFLAKQELSQDTLKKLKALDIDYIIFHFDLMNSEEQTKYQATIRQNAIVFNNKQTVIVNLKSYPFSIVLCRFEDLKKQELKGIINTSDSFNALLLENSRDCYLPSIYTKRYKEVDYFTSSGKKKAHIILPIIIGPLEKVILNERDKTLTL